ncbi:glycosyl transferase [Polyplosphaeria fusca]|uniref:Glycosyl transferase n=1 Tax=Polyplosphaeria fusca TaxID=682080 RepID=A0A9P4QU60_9PLEO|nr:glycosyl transferase [Polyplosphaeria fusca]
MSNQLPPSSPSPPRKVWATLLTHPSYLPGLLTLSHSLRRHTSSYPLIALYTDALPPSAHAALDLRGIPKRRIDALKPATERQYEGDARFEDTWTKLGVWGLTEFERVGLLDADMLVRRNMDEVLGVGGIGGDGDGGEMVFAAGHACVCNPLGRGHYPETWVPENCAYTSQHNDPDAAQSAAAPCTYGLGALNSGLLVVNPSEQIFSSILAALKDPSTATYTFPDQELLQNVFRGRWVPLPYVYNALKTLRWQGVHGKIWRDEEVRNVHYILTPKPWESRKVERKEDEVVCGWWFEAEDERGEAERKAGICDGF